MEKRVFKKIYLMLLAGSVAGTLAVFPYLFTIQKDVLAALPIPVPAFVAAQTVQAAVLFALVIWIGLKLTQKTGINLPVLHAWAAGEPVRPLLAVLPGQAVFPGILSALAILIIDLVFSRFHTGVTLFQELAGPWKGLLASFYGGICEEVLLRLFLVTLLIWMGSKTHRNEGGTVAPVVAWTAIIIGTLVFGALHLPLTASLTAITPLVVIRALLLNGIPGTVFGWLYWKRGLVYAMAAHFCADIILHVVVQAMV